MSPLRRCVLAAIVSAVSVCALCTAAAAPVPAHAVRLLDKPENSSSSRGIPTAQVSIERGARPSARNNNQRHHRRLLRRAKGARSMRTGTPRAHLHLDGTGVGFVVVHFCGQLLPSLRRPLRRPRGCMWSCSLRPPIAVPAVCSSFCMPDDWNPRPCSTTTTVVPR
jgi:hypothetical protein